MTVFNLVICAINRQYCRVVMEYLKRKYFKKKIIKKKQKKTLLQNLT